MEEEKKINDTNPSEENPDIKEKNVSNENDINLDIVYVDHNDYNPDVYADRIEEKRADFFKAYKASRRNSNIATIVVLVIAVVSVILITSEPMVCKIIGWVLAGLAVAGMIAYYIVNHNKLPNKANDFIKEISYSINQRVFDDPKYSKVEYNPKEKMQISDIVSDNVYTNIEKIPSRNIVRGRFDNHGFLCSDIGLYEAGNKKSKAPLFVGKYVSMQNDLHFEGRYVLVSKAANPVDLPNSVSDLSVLSEDEKHVIYGPENGKFNEDLGREFLSRINHIEVKEYLLGLAIVIWAGHTAGYLSYGDEVMSIPFDKSFNLPANEQFRSNLRELLEAFRKILK